MKISVFALSTVFVVLSTIMHAQPSFECAQADSAAETLICTDESLATLDRRMADRYASAQDAVNALSSGATQALQILKATQRGWIKGRNACWKSVDLHACVVDAYLTRDAELVATWMLEEPFQVRSYSCEDNPAHEVVVFFFATDRPSLRLEYGDQVHTAWQVPAASGSKYAMQFGGLFWSKGDDAQLEWATGEAAHCLSAD